MPPKADAAGRQQELDAFAIGQPDSQIQTGSDSISVDPHDSSNPLEGVSQPRSTSTDDSPHWNANYTAQAKSSKKRRQSSVVEAVQGAQSPQEIVRRLSLDVRPKDPIDPDPRNKYPELNLSGKVISATFSVPYKIKYRIDGPRNNKWDLNSRRGTSALFDSFSYLSSSASPWRHTLVGWTGEIDPISGAQLAGGSASVKTVPINKAAAAIPVDPHAKRVQPNEVSDLVIPREDREALEKQLAHDHGSRVLPVWLNDDIYDDDAFMFRHQERWRRYGEHELFNLFHYKQNEPSDGRATKRAWEDYEYMNEAFADAIMNVYKPGDIVIVHDYQLLLLPQKLRQRMSSIYVGFFLHIPFPSSEYYRSLNRRKQVLQGMLGANTIGFQAPSYATHFASCCLRVLDLEGSEGGIKCSGSYIPSEVFPIGIDALTTKNAAFSPDVEEKMQKLKDEKVYDGKKIIVGRDRLDSVRGVAKKLQAFETFLELFPEWREKVVLVQVTSPTSIADRDEKRDNNEAKISDLVARINGEYGHLGYTPVQYYPQYLSKEEYFALLRIADLGLITSVRDGMNTTALEYVICQREKRSPLIISEFSGTAHSLMQAITINPWDLSGVANSINDALQLSKDAKVASHFKLYQTVMDNSVQSWTNKYLDRLLANLKLYDRSQVTPALNRSELLKRYAKSSRRLFLFDYDGTLTPIVNNPNSAIPTDRTIRTIKILASDPRNSVWIISGRDQGFLDEYLGHISALGLSAEHGCFIRKPHSSEWINLTEQYDMGWQHEVWKVFERYSSETRGSRIEQKKVALTWHYREAHDQTFALAQARRCQKELNDSIAKDFDVDIMAGKANLEVRPRFVNKGEITSQIVKEYGEGGDKAPDFILCLGDDSTDEDMFQKLRYSKLPEDQVFTVTVGSGPKQTLARYGLTEPADVISVLASLNEFADSGFTRRASSFDDQKALRTVQE